MILYYAVGGGLGHLTRARAVVHTLGLQDPVTVVSASPHARDPRVLGAWHLELLPPELATDLARTRHWLAGVLERVAPRMVIVDAFPCGILGELCDFLWPQDLELLHVARLLRWPRYRARIEGRAPVFHRTLVLEPLGGDHREFLAGCSRQLMPLALVEPPAESGESKGLAESRDGWLVVHSEPESEVLELVAYAEELRRRRAPGSRLRLVSPQRPEELPRQVEHLSQYPAWPLFEQARHIVSACGFNTMRQTEPFRDKHSFLPFERPLDDQFERARRRRRMIEQASAR